ncbi:transglutaminase-like domain-containing protein [Agathobaculum sp.]|uniref:transglutaminase-like domain-containing protein n=1 Tax=Agathobaculum sp. TaxID=2048138 RepID=UPI00307B95A6
MNEISVKTLYPDGSTSPYRALALPAFASLCLMAGALLVLFRTWDELAVPRWALVLAAAAGYVSASAAHRLSRRHGAFYLLGLVPWIPALLMPAACVRGLAAWVSGLTARWNVLHDGSAQLLNTAPDIVDEKAAAFIGAMLIAQAAHFVVVHRYRVLGAVLGGFWIALGLADGCFSPLGAALMLAGMLALYVSDISLHLTRAAWRTLGILLALLAQADTLHRDTRGMLSVTEGQEKTLYLRGYIGGMYADGAWKPLPGLIYSEEYAGMMKWLSGRGFDPARQPAAYLALCGDSEAEPNDVTVETLAASREYVYIPGTANELSGARVTENERDSTSRARGVLGARRYTASELSGSRPSELTVAEDWVRAPQTPGQQAYLESEAVYRGFVYDSYTAVSDTIAPTLDRLFWEDYDDSNDGIYSAVSRVREVLRDEMTYTETPSEAPGSEDPLAWFLTGGREGNAVQYASAAAMALRAHGIPARYCEGYLLTAAQVQAAEGGAVTLTGANAHAWCEAYFDGVGWLPVDVTPGFYYDALALQQLVAMPDSIRRTAAIEDAGHAAGEVTQTDDSGADRPDGLLDGTVYPPELLLGIPALLLILASLAAAALECTVLLCRVRVFSDFKHASPEQRARLLAWWGQRILAARGVEAMIGWHTEETDAKLAEMIDTVNPGEYRRVCGLLEKAIYGGIALKVYEERAVYSLLDRLYTAPAPDFATGRRLHYLLLAQLGHARAEKME